MDLTTHTIEQLAFRQVQSETLRSMGYSEIAIKWRCAVS